MQNYITKDILTLIYQGRIRRGGARRAVPPRHVMGGIDPPEQSFHTFQILNSRVKNMKKLVCCSFSALRRATMTEVRMKNLYRIHIHPYIEWRLSGIAM